MDLEESFEGTWKDFRDEWIRFLKNDILSECFIYSRYTMNTSKKTHLQGKIVLLSHLWDEFFFYKWGGKVSNLWFHRKTFEPHEVISRSRWRSRFR